MSGGYHLKVTIRFNLLHDYSFAEPRYENHPKALICHLSKPTQAMDLLLCEFLFQNLFHSANYSE
jgi:hypothetical protein